MVQLQRLVLLTVVPGFLSVATAVEYDVVVVGGGSSGTHAAVRLQQLGKSVALVEKECRLGGHTNTYKDTATGDTFDYGTQILVNTTTVRDFFASLNISLAPFKPGGQPKAVDFRNSVVGPSWPVVDANASAVALDKYQTLLTQYQDDFFLGFHLPDPIPEDLLMPWGDFLRKHDLSALAYDGFLQFQGMGNILAQPTLYVMKLFNPMQVSARKNKTKVSETNHNMQALWDAAEQKLGSGNSTVVKCANITSIKRESSRVTLTANTPSGLETIRAKRLLMTIPPKAALLNQFLDMTTEEKDLFSRFNSSSYWNAVVSNTNFPPGTSLYNHDSNAPFGIPSLPGAYYFNPEINNLYSVQYSTPSEEATDDFFTADILASAQRIRQALDLPPCANTTIVASNNHSPFALTVAVDEIRNGFYRRFVALQGGMGTFWTGANWASGSSSTIWEFTEREVLPAVLGSLK